MKKWFWLLLLTLCMATSVVSQNLVIKNNLLYDALVTPNLGLELGLGAKTTLDLTYGLNPFTFQNNEKWKHWSILPEIRLWSCERFNGFFFGAHLLGGEFNLGGVDIPFKLLPFVKEKRYQGYFYGGGLSVGYQWPLSNRWNLEASIGGGYVQFNFNEFLCPYCGPRVDTETYHYFGPTKATLSLLYMLY